MEASSLLPLNDVALSSSPPKINLELLNSSSSYTSLRDLIPSPTAAVNSPTAAHASSPFSNIPIRNRLVKHAAWAYLQPMSSLTSPSSTVTTTSLLRRLRFGLSACFRWFFHRILGFSV
ncbi:hypothetical protein ACFE04_014522 [Oxalis oulophora]